MEALKNNIPNELYSFARRTTAAGEPVYAVGGAVRDALLGKPPKDIDITSALRPDDVKRLCAEAGLECVSTGERFGTTTIVFDTENGKMPVEHTTFRSDTYSSGGEHQPETVRFSDSIEEDAFRRDFTMNALYYDIAGDRLIDPTGGAADIQRRVIRATSADPSAIMGDDALRILRLIRFAAQLDFDIDQGTLEAARANVAGLEDISWERRRSELFLLLVCEPGPMLRSLHLMDDMGAFKYLLPELETGRGMAQRARYHAYDVLEHNLRACAAAKPTDPAGSPLTIRLAALIHDVGKPYAVQRNGMDAKHPMLGHDRIGAEIAEPMLQRLRCPNRLIEDVCWIISHHMFDLDGNAKRATLRKAFARWGGRRAEQIAEIREADVLGSGRITGRVESAERFREELARMRDEGAPFALGDLKCSGREVMEWCSMTSGEEVGRVLEALLEHCAVKPADNTPKRLKKLCADYRHGIDS